MLLEGSSMVIGEHYDRTLKAHYEHQVMAETAL